MLDRPLNFIKGIKDGIPIALGYLSVSFAFGILAVNNGLPAWMPIIISATNLTGTGQFVGSELIALSASLTEIAFTLLVVNARYILMSISLSQRLSPNVHMWQRLIIAFGNTDEIFGVAMNQNGLLNFKYLSGIILTSYIGWLSGTAIGALAGSIIPNTLLSALGIALFAMFIAIIIPSAKTSRAIMIVVGISIAISVLFYYTPVLNRLNKSWVIIIAGLISAGVCAVAFPIKNVSCEVLEPPPYTEKEDKEDE